jgi:hypothetical protein
MLNDAQSARCDLWSQADVFFNTIAHTCASKGSSEQNDAERGLKRETRLMEKRDGQWKIAGMHTTIYGFKKEE